MIRQCLIKNKKYEAFISRTVIEEIEETSEPKRSKLINLIKDYQLIILEVDEQTEQLASKYIAHKIIPEKYELDTLHIAIAVINNLDVIVSWNFEHIVKIKTRLEVNGVNKLEGYREIEICSPLEVVENES